MSGLIRRIVISATATGLLLQPSGNSEYQKSLIIDFKSQKLTEYQEPKQQQHHQNVPQLDVHGLIGKSSPQYGLRDPDNSQDSLTLPIYPI